jgi:hypothetical protein
MDVPGSIDLTPADLRGDAGESRSSEQVTIQWAPLLAPTTAPPLPAPQPLPVVTLPRTVTSVSALTKVAAVSHSGRIRDLTLYDAQAWAPAENHANPRDRATRPPHQRTPRPRPPPGTPPSRSPRPAVGWPEGNLTLRSACWPGYYTTATWWSPRVSRSGCAKHEAEEVHARK